MKGNTLSQPTAPIYLPAIGATTTGYLKETDETLIGGENRPLSPRFFNTGTESYYSHPYCLISAAHHYRGFPDIRKSIGIKDDTLVFIDSGGYQLATGIVSAKKYNSKIALDWSEKNGNIFPILDHPVTPGCDPRERLETSVFSAKYYEENRSVSNRQILNVVSGANIDGSRVWYDAIKKHKLDGWAHGGHRGVLTPVLQTFMMLGMAGEFNKDYTVPYHIFGVSSQVALIYFAVLQQEANRRGWNVQVMSDSSSFQITLGHGNLMLFPGWTSMANIRISNKYDYSKMVDTARMPCDCPVCDGITNVKAWVSDPKQFYLLGVLHNLYMVLRFKNTVDNIINCGVDEIARDSFPAQIAKNIEAIRVAMRDPKTGIERIQYTFVHRDAEEQMASLEGFFGE